MEAPGTSAAGLALWLPVVLFAHVFAAFWLGKTLLLGRGRLRKRKAGGLAGRASLEGPTPALPLAGAGAGAPIAVGRGSAAGLAGPLQVHTNDACSERLDQEAASPFETDKGAAVAAQGDGSDAGASTASDADEVPDASPLACATLRQHLSVAPETFHMEWQAMGCSYSHHGVTKVVLQDVWGKAHPGEMQALMGPSGAGKSTFMDILAMRKSVGAISGRLLLSGQPATKAFIRQTAYVPQEDNFVPTMTTLETLTFYAQVILPASWSKARRRERVGEVLDAVGLGGARKTLVGGCLPGGLMMRGLSGGERKRLSIAAGILAAPAVLFLDEPTSGLDSFAALSVMGHLQLMARAAGHIVLSTIHQPRAAIWAMFDQVTLLAGGRLMYTGPRDGLTRWFSGLGYAYDINQGVASDWALDLVAVGFAKPAKYYGATMRTRDDLAAAAAAFRQHYMAAQGIKTPQRAGSANSLGGGDDASGAQGASPPAAGSGRRSAGGLSVAGIAERVRSAVLAGVSLTDIQPDKASKYPTGSLRQFGSLLWREFILVTRNPFDVAGRCLTFTWVAILIGLLYYSMPTDGSSMRSRLNLCYVALSFVVLMPYISMGLYTSDKKFYLADASAQLYRPLAYYLAKVVVTTPFQVICALCFAWTLYGMAGMRGGGVHVAKFGTIVTLVYLVSVQVLHACAIVAPNQDTAFMLSIVWTTLQMLVSTFFVVFSEVTYNYWLTQLRYISAVYFGFEALVLNEFSGVLLDCSQGMAGGYMAFVLTAFPRLSQGERATLRQLERPRPNCVVDAQSIIDYFEFGRPFGHSAAILAAYLAIMHLATFAAMLVSARKEAR